MKFCVVILILKIEENDHFQHIVLYYFKKIKNATEMQKKVCAMCGEGAVIDCTISWRFHAGRCSTVGETGGS